MPKSANPSFSFDTQMCLPSSFTPDLYTTLRNGTVERCTVFDTLSAHSSIPFLFAWLTLSLWCPSSWASSSGPVHLSVVALLFVLFTIRVFRLYIFSRVDDVCHSQIRAFGAAHHKRHTLFGSARLTEFWTWESQDRQAEQ